MKDRDEKGRFLKGIIPWSKGKKIPHTEEEKQKISEMLKGRVVSEETREKISEGNKGYKKFLGKHHSEQTKKKLSEILKGNKYCLGRKRSEDEKRKISETMKGRKVPWVLGKHLSEKTKEKLSDSKKGRTVSKEVRGKISKTLIGRFIGKNHPNWNGGKRLADARQRHKRRKRGFVLITDKNPYDKPFEYHHIHPDLPYVVPCPKRIHQMFHGREKTHYFNVNIMLGFRFETEESCNQNVKNSQSS